MDSQTAELRPAEPRPKTSLIKHRPVVGSVTAVLISIGFAILATPIVMGEAILESSRHMQLVVGKPSPITVRIPQFFRSGQWQGGPIVVRRGEMVSEKQLQVAKTRRYPTTKSTWLAHFCGLFLLGLLYTLYLRRSHNGRLLRTQVVTLLLLLCVAACIKLALIFTAVSALIAPVAGAAIIAAAVVNLSAGVVTGIAASVVVGLLTPFDLGVLGVLIVQSLISVVLLGDRHRRGMRTVFVGIAGGIAAAIMYTVIYYLSWHQFPIHELSQPLRSPWLAAAAGGILSALVVLPATPIYQFLLGEVTHSKLVTLSDLSNPLLKQIAKNSPGTWQHSLAMANMAETAANAIGANARLVRVGAYYHDLGKSLQPNYFIENLTPGQPSPHDQLPPEMSADAIFAHVTEGVRLGRKKRLPERVIDFMHMHHGDGILEYFWAKCEAQGNPQQLTRDHFRYPGVPPQTRETAILAIVDAVEAASRTLRSSDSNAIRNLVQRIVYGKLHLGQLDDSGLTVADLRGVSDSLMETIKHAFHGRIEYPWQKEQNEAQSQIDSERPRQPSPVAQLAQSGVRVTQRMMAGPRLDSLDIPRPDWTPATVSSESKNGLPAPATTPTANHDPPRADSPRAAQAPPGSSPPSTKPPQTKP